MHRIALAQLAVLATSVHAFFPWVPEYACNQFHGCEDQDKRALPVEAPVTRDAAPEELWTLKLAQRTSPVCVLTLSVTKKKKKKLKYFS